MQRFSFCCEIMLYEDCLLYTSKPYVGDDIVLDLTDDDTPVISSIKERKNVFERPPVANVEQFIVVNAFVSPEPNFVVIDKFLTMAELKDVDVVMCFNKADLSMSLIHICRKAVKRHL